MRRLDWRRIALVLAAPLLAVVFAFGVTSLVLLAAGDPVVEAWQVMFQYGEQPRSIALVINQATYLYISAIAVAIGFRMNLFNIGVEGQYRIAALAAAIVVGEVTLPFPLSAIVAVLVAMLVGALWASIAGILKVTRGVSEVISTIMLNAIATALAAFVLRQVAVPVAGSNNIGTREIAEGSRVPGLPLVPGSTVPVSGLIVLAVLVGVAYWFLLNRTRFGFDLRATGQSRTAAVASGVNVTRMVVVSMALSGAVAGLVGLPLLLGEAFTYSLIFPAGLGFAGIAIALIGRNNPLGIAVGALLFAYLNVSSNPLQLLAGVATEVVAIMQGIIVLSVVVAYEVVRRYALAQEQRRVAQELAEGRRTLEPQGVGA